MAKFEKGKSGNAQGRPPGALNKLDAEAKDKLGRFFIDTVRWEK